MGNTELVSSSHCDVIDPETIEGTLFKANRKGLSQNSNRLLAKINIHKFDDNLANSVHIPTTSWFTRMDLTWKLAPGEGTQPKLEVSIKPL